jgi:hypothetical protein
MLIQNYYRMQQERIIHHQWLVVQVRGIERNNVEGNDDTMFNKIGDVGGWEG